MLPMQDKAELYCFSAILLQQLQSSPKYLTRSVVLGKFLLGFLFGFYFTCECDCLKKDRPNYVDVWK